MNKAEKILLHDKLDALGEVIDKVKDDNKVRLVNRFNDIREVIKKL